MLEVKKKLKAGFSFLLLFGESIEAFPGHKKEALRSFLIPLLLFPVNMWIVTYYPSRELRAYDLDKIWMIASFRAVLGFGLSILYAYVIAYMFKQRAHLWRFFEAVNWTSLAFSILTFPVVFSAMMDWMTGDKMDRGLMLLSLYFYLVIACIANKSFKLNWQLAGFIGIMMLLSHQHSWDIVSAIWDIPYAWDY